MPTPRRAAARGLAGYLVSLRRTDNLGRVVLPVELRRILRLAPGDSLEIFVDGPRVVLKRYEPGCVFCGALSELVGYRDRLVCRACIRDASARLLSPAPPSPASPPSPPAGGAPSEADAQGDPVLPS